MAQRTGKAWDEEMGPHIIFADGEQSIYLANMSGDGLTFRRYARVQNEREGAGVDRHHAEQKGPYS